ncbi:hypothetical protein [Clostridium botulinum]|uniref:hypothetical protein n=1 Tax=Clostridium botulinum TaxID=1491 RepID=UPI00035BA423|nr:hypothetical protein [Clostridium botulinum]EPS48157.1 hypothetical protein CFSAN002367_21207 [Clostridium botulinum CFSAN002367]KON10074.1 hypothetical protein ACP52_08005 [Clostridium botulinum]KOR54838.1 hypothetical protein ADT23_00140 [Clostridium botulinum]MBD5587662.1 hypothetical protein [Clostridium botulinum]MBY6839560.1 hypothetical protein [Clostridium botulinum]
MFILKFSNQDCWIAPWEGDPGRTLIRDSAREFKSKAAAEKFANKIIKTNSYRKFSLVVEPK